MVSTSERIQHYVAFSSVLGRSAIARDLDLPLPTVVTAVRRLLATGALVETDDPNQPVRAGRPSRGLKVTGPATLIGLIRWQGAGLQASCLDVEGATLTSDELDRPDPALGVTGLFDAVDAVVRRARQQRDGRLGLIVISVPAPYLSGRGVPPEHATEVPAPVQFPVVASGDLESMLTERHGIPVLMENDANLAAVGELYRGAGREADHSIYLKLTQSGFGSALIVNGALVRGAQGYAGELAHMQVDRAGALCACGGRGCLRYRVKEQIVDAAQPAYDEPIDFGDLPRMAAAGDVGAVRMLQDIGRVLGEPLARLSTVLDPELIIVGGSFGPGADEVIVGIREAIAVQAPPAIANNVRIVTGELGDHGEEQGALELARLSARRG